MGQTIVHHCSEAAMALRSDQYVSNFLAGLLSWTREPAHSSIPNPSGRTGWPVPQQTSWSPIMEPATIDIVSMPGPPPPPSVFRLPQHKPRKRPSNTMANPQDGKPTRGARSFKSCHKVFAKNYWTLHRKKAAEHHA